MADTTKTCIVTKTGNLRTAKCRMSFPNLFEAVAKNDENPTDLRFSASLVIPSDADITLLKKEAGKAAVEKWGADKIPGNMNNPFREAAELNRAEYRSDDVVIRVDSKFRPGVVDAQGRTVTSAEGHTVTGENANGTQIIELIEDNRVYAGRHCYATLSPYAYPSIKGGKPGVKFHLQNLQLLDHDEAWSGGGAKAEDDFEAVAGTGGDAAAAGLGADELFGTSASDPALGSSAPKDPANLFG